MTVPHCSKTRRTDCTGASVDGLLTQEGPATTEVTDEYGVRHRMWRVSDPGLVELVRGKMRDKKLIIADGHHRYETALNYRNARRSAEPQSVGAPRERAAATLLRSLETEEAPYDLVMMTFVNMNSPGLVVLPTHRVVSELPSFSPSELRLPRFELTSTSKQSIPRSTRRAPRRFCARPGT